MQAEEVILFLAVATLALTLVVVLAVPKLRTGGGGSGGVRTRAEPASRPIQSPDVAAPAPPAAVVAPAVSTASGSAPSWPGGLRALSPSPLSVGPDDSVVKICPSCARRYATAARVCGRDGTALVSVN